MFFSFRHKVVLLIPSLLAASVFEKFTLLNVSHTILYSFSRFSISIYCFNVRSGSFLIFFCPGGAPVLVKGELEKIREKKLKGLPDPVQLYDDIVSEGGRVILCELALENKDIKVEDVREGVEIMSAPSFLLDAVGAGLSLVF